MTFAVFLPEEVASENVAPNSEPLASLTFLSGLASNCDNFMQKAGAFKCLAGHRVVLITCDTSPRGFRAPGDDDHWDFGLGAGFYLNATQEPWSKAYHMATYVVDELPMAVSEALGGRPLDPARRAIFGHSMGGHGAISLGLKHQFASISAFAPICSPSTCPWGKKAFTNYLGADPASWAEWDSAQLVAAYQGPARHILVDQGTEDKFLKDGQLQPEALEAAAASNSAVTVEIRRQPGYDHSYYFIASFVESHIKFHLENLNA